MPPDPKAKTKRRASRRDSEDFRFDASHARELEVKRSRGEVSCAECRRLKIKCDKSIPCESCVRRGCAALCPNGSLSTGQGTRFVLAATEHLHRRISRMGDRIRQLEDALATLHARHSDEPHPLLQEDAVSESQEAAGDETTLSLNGEEKQQPQKDVLDAFGTLSISDHGISRFFGPTGGSESLLLSQTPNDPSSDGLPTPESSTRGSLSPSHGSSTSGQTYDHFSRAFPFTPMGPAEEVMEIIKDKLPVRERARAMCESFFSQVGWIYRGTTRTQVFDELVPTIYDTIGETPPGSINSSYGPHDLALLFLLFALGVLVGDGDESEAEHYHQIARAAIGLQPVLEKPSIVTVQALHLMSIYNGMSGQDLVSETSMEMTWSLITLAAHLSQTIGLHRDPERWGLSPVMVQRRRILFWDMFVADVWSSLNTGRPPSFALPYIDCKYPRYDGVKTRDGLLSFEIWQFKFAAEVVAEVTSRTLTAEAPTYATIMELDKKVREFPMPEGMDDKDLGKKDLALSFQKCVLEHVKETVLMYIHRSFFAQAIIDQPENPLKSPYAPSFLAAYRASTTILKSVRENFAVWPNSSARHWAIWTFAFSAAVVFGTVVSRGPRSPLASSAMAELEQACLLFAKAAVYSKRAAKAMPVLTKLSEKARHALAGETADGSAGMLWSVKIEEDDELNIIAGRTRFVSKRQQQPIVPAVPPYSPEQQPQQPQSVSLEPVQYSQGHPNAMYVDAGYGVPDNMQLSPVRMVDDRQHSYSSAQYSYSYDRSGGSASYHPQHHPHRSPACPSQRPDPREPHPAQLSQSHPHEMWAAPYISSQHSHPHPPPQQVYQMHPDLAGLGLASRDSRLDERWSSFMHESGLLDGFNRQR